VLGAHDAGAELHTAVLVRENKGMTVEEAVWRLSGQPASIFGIPDRGVIAPQQVRRDGTPVDGAYPGVVVSG
jgi:N-acyl-D-aspartate/D-glutamate deacylase